MPPPAPAIADFTAPAEVEPVTPVWVLLDELVRHDTTPHRVVADGLLMTGRTRGLLKRWARSSRGLWLGIVNVQLDYADGRREVLILRDQLVPAYALAPRSDGRPLG